MDRLRLVIVPTRHAGFEIQVFVNDVEMTALGAGMGMDPYELIVPAGRMAGGPEPVALPIAQCGCGTYECGSTDVVVTRDGDVVHWDWKEEVPMERRVTFAAREYDEEVLRLESDHEWETTSRRVGRLVLTALLDRDLPEGCSVDWLGTSFRDATSYTVCLIFETYQVFVQRPWGSMTAEEIAEDIVHVLTQSVPASWPASWHSMTQDPSPPSIAGPGWFKREF